MILCKYSHEQLSHSPTAGPTALPLRLILDCVLSSRFSTRSAARGGGITKVGGDKGEERGASLRRTTPLLYAITPTVGLEPTTTRLRALRSAD